MKKSGSSSLFSSISGETLQKLSDEHSSLSDLHSHPVWTHGRAYVEKCTMMTPIGIR